VQKEYIKKLQFSNVIYLIEVQHAALQSSVAAAACNTI
jgi:hypothetical protein